MIHDPPMKAKLPVYGSEFRVYGEQFCPSRSNFEEFGNALSNDFKQYHNPGEISL